MSDTTSGPPRPAPGRAPRSPQRLLVQACRRWFHEDCGQRAAAIAYYALLSFFPFIILLGSVASVLVGDDAGDIRTALQPLRPLLPELQAGFWDRVQDLVENRGVLSAASFGLLVFLSTRVSVAVQRALRPVFRPGQHPPRRRMRGTKWFLAHFMTLLALLSIGMVLTGVTVLEFLVRASAAPRWVHDVVASNLFTRHVLPLVVLSLLTYALFGVLPEVAIRRRWRVVGAVFFACSHDVAVSAWARITGKLAGQDVVYGSFVGAVSFAGWTWVAASLLLLAAAVVAELNALPEPVPEP